MLKPSKRSRARASNMEESVHEDLVDTLETEHHDEADAIVQAPLDPELRVKLSAELMRKLRDMSREEGIDLPSLVSELLAEGVTLRAWEIIERKSAMRGHSAGGQPQSNGNQRYGNHRGGPNDRQGHQRGGSGERHGNNRYGYNQGNRRSGGNMANNSWMEDKAAFLEYVRNQEKQRRR